MARGGNPSEIDKLGAEIRTAVSRLYSRFRSERAPGELGDAAVWALVALHRRGPMVLGELSAAAKVTPGSMSQTVNRLAAEGYLQRHKDPDDGRRVLFALTEPGRTMARTAHAHRTEWLAARLSTLTDKQRQTLADAAALLTTIADS